MNTNLPASKTQLDLIREQISSSLEKAQAQRNRLKHSNSRYTTANIVLAALATLLAGVAGTIGTAKSWKPVCLFAAVCSVGVTVTAKLQTAESLTEASECVGQLKALNVETMAPTFDLNQVSAKYQQILSQYTTIDI